MKINTLTNQITYNRLLRATRTILRKNVFEANDDFTRNDIMVKLKELYSKASDFAIQDYRITMKPFNTAKPHYIELDIAILFKELIHYVHLNINNED